MRAINHALTGAVIAVVVPHPVVALPLAVISHFVCDVIPHFDTPWLQGMASKRFKAALLIDASLCVLLVAFLYGASPNNWLLPSLCAFAAASPDFTHVPKWLAAVRGKTHQISWLEKFHSNIQWFQRPSGIAVEIPWAAVMIFVLLKKL